MNRDFKDMREQYGEELLDENSVSDNPFELFEYWFQAVKTSEIKEPNAMVLATVDEDLQPDARVVLLKEIADGGFVFYTNFSSAKGPRAWSFCVEMPISAPSPNMPPSVKRVEALA